MKAVHSLQGFTNQFEHAHLNHISNVKNMVIYHLFIYLRSLKTDQHAHLISLNDPQIHASGKNDENYNQ